MAEEITKGLVARRLKQLGYPEQDIKEKGIVYHKEDSYIQRNNYISECLKHASKTLTNERGIPDFIITSDNHKIIIVIECKESIEKHSTQENVNNYRKGIGTKEIKDYCINGALHYATFLNYENDVIAIAASGIKEDNNRLTSFVLPKGESLESIKNIEDGNIFNSLTTFDDYKKTIDKVLGRNVEIEQKLQNELASFAKASAEFMRSNTIAISTKDRAGFISACVLALSNKDTDLYKNLLHSLPDKRIKKPFKDEIGKNAIKYLKEALNTVWISHDLPSIKKRKLEAYYDYILKETLLYEPNGKDNKYFEKGDTILSCYIFAVYENITYKLENNSCIIDIMGTFYTEFLKKAKGDAKDKGIVLTPKHITEFFCDIAEHYLGRPLDETMKILDICAGTGSFLISAFNKIKTNINNQLITEDDKKTKIETVKNSCLYGVEIEQEMFALMYANMSFHGDGKSNIYCCSSLLKDEKTKGIIDDKTQKTIKEELDGIKFNVGMINPPYSMDDRTKEKKKGEKQAGNSELDFIYSMLSYLDKGGIGIAIVPISCASNSGKKMRETILSEHTLLACMEMPKKLFSNSDVNTPTCIMVFKAHVKHNDSDKIVFLSRRLDDGFVTVPHNGRYDKNGDWLPTKKEWLRQLKGLSTNNDTVFLKRELNITDECLAVAYLETNYDNLTQDDFIKYLKKYALFKYLEDEELIENA